MNLKWCPRILDQFKPPPTVDRAAFWEFVAGPLNAGSFGPNPLVKTFGPEVVFEKAPPHRTLT